MKKFISLTTVFVLVCFATMVFAADAAAPAVSPTTAVTAKATETVTSEAVKVATGETVIGTIKKIDIKANTIVVKEQIITVKAKDIGKLKVGEKVKITLVPGTMKAKKVLVLEKKTLDEKAKKTEQKAVEKAVDTAVEKAAQ